MYDFLSAIPVIPKLFTIQRAHDDKLVVLQRYIDFDPILIDDL
jgi:hypothetical protein